jgi:hypothetical protein
VLRTWVVETVLRCRETIFRGQFAGCGEETASLFSVKSRKATGEAVAVQSRVEAEAPISNRPLGKLLIFLAPLREQSARCPDSPTEEHSRCNEKSRAAGNGDICDSPTVAPRPDPSPAP